MPLNLYVMPIVGVGTENDLRRPKYHDSLFPSLQWGMFDYGNEPWCLVGINNVPPATNSALIANADVFGLPQNLDQLIGSGAPLNQARNGLEAANIPGTWIASTNSYRDVVRFVGAVCQFMQRYQGQGFGILFSGGVTLATTFAGLPAGVGQHLVTTASAFGFSTSTMTGTNTMRTIIKAMGDAYVAAGLPLYLAGVAL